MSAIASFMLLPRAALEGLRRAAVPKKRLFFGPTQDTYWDFLEKNGKEVGDYRWSGYVLATLLCCLEQDHQINLLKSPYDDLGDFLSKARGNSHVIFCNEHKNVYLEKFDQAQFSVEKLRDYYSNFNEVDAPDAGLPMLDGVHSIQRSLAQLDETSVVILIIA
jgi:hypothetical protein